jgi:hypothetical protein
MGPKTLPPFDALRKWVRAECEALRRSLGQQFLRLREQRERP